MSYYHDLVVAKSWEELKKLKKEIDFLLIGGWAVYFYTHGLKSKDIDIIIGYEQLSVLAGLYTLNKNERLKKYEAVKEEVQIDIYLPHFSDLGVAVEKLIGHEREIEGFEVLDIDYLFSLKIYTLGQRGRSEKGRKDFLDIIALWQTGQVKMPIVKKILADFKMTPDIDNLKKFLSEANQAEELGLNFHSFSKIKKELLDSF